MAHKTKALAGAQVITASALAVLGAGQVVQAQAEPAQAEKAGRAAVPAPDKAAADATPYTPSKYPGVMVSNAPANAPADATATPAAGTHKAWIYVKPGAKPHIRPRVGTRGDGIWYERGKTSAGGMIAHVTPRFYPYSKATVKPGHKANAGTHHAASHGATAKGKAKAAVHKAPLTTRPTG